MELELEMLFIPKFILKDSLFLDGRKNIGEEIWVMLKVSGPHLIPLGHLSGTFYPLKMLHLK